MTAEAAGAQARVFFEDVLGRAQAANAACGGIVRDLDLAGVLIRLIFAGPALEELLMPAIDHLRVERSGAPDIVCHVWDSRSSGVSQVPAPVSSDCFSERGDIAGLGGDDIKVAFQPSDYSLSLYDVGSGTGIFWLEDFEDVPYWTQAAPFRTLFHWWVEQRGGALVHGAVVANQDGGLLITGKGGTGKSTSALSCVAAGFSYVGDDYVALFAGPPVIAYSLYRTAKLNPDNAAWFGALHPRLLGANASRGEGKLVAFLPPGPQAGIVRSSEVTAIATPCFADGPATTIRAAAPEALLMTAISTSLAQLPGAGRILVDRVTQIVGQLPGFVLCLGSTVNDIPVVIAGLLRNPGPVAHQDPDVRALPFLSLVIHAGADPALLAESLAEIPALGCPNMEVIVVDRGASGIEAVIESLPIQPRLVRVQKDDRGGGADLERVGPGGEVILVLQPGDRLVPDMLLLALELLRDNVGVDVVEAPATSSGGGSVLRHPPRRGAKVQLPQPLLKRRVSTDAPGDVGQLALSLARQALQRKRAIGP